MSMMYDYNRREEILYLVYSNFPELKDFNIPIVFTDEIPERLIKLLKTTNNEKKKATIYKLLGEYLPQNNTIKIYLQGFRFIFQYREIDEQNIKEYQTLFKIVILHEIGHYWFYNHSGLSVQYNDLLLDITGNEELNQEKSCFIHEWVAQIFAYICLENEEERAFMKKFAENQPPEYGTFVRELNFIELKCIFRNVSKLLHLPEVFERILKWKRMPDRNIVDTIQDILNDPKIKLSIIECRLPDNVDFRKINEIAGIKNETDKYNL